MSDQNWRTETNALDYLGHQKKKVGLADRRPVIRKPSDLVGPGIAANAIRLDDFNDHLATYDGFFSADVGALNAPNSTDAFVGTVTSDETLGGVQTFAGLTTGSAYQRVFNRNPSDEATIYWGDWEVIGTAGTGGGTFLETLPVSIINAKGDLIVGTGDNTAIRQGVGPDSTVLAADSTAPGGMGWETRVKAIIADGDITVDNTDPEYPIVSSGGGADGAFQNTDHRTVTTEGTVTFVLTYVPFDGSLQIKWEGIDQPPSEWTLDGQIVTFVNPHLHVGDAIVAYYYYYPAATIETTLVLRGTTKNTGALPVETEGGDFIVVATRDGSPDFSGDSRLTEITVTPSANRVWVGNATDLSALSHTGSISKCVVAAFVGSMAVTDVDAATHATNPHVGPMPGIAAIAVPGEYSSFVSGAASLPSPWILADKSGDAQFVEVLIYYWIDPTASDTPDTTANSAGGVDVVDLAVMTVQSIGE